jgi:hypothetical protein
VLFDESTDDAVAAGKALGDGLAVQGGGFEAAFADASEKVRLERVETARA